MALVSAELRFLKGRERRRKEKKKEREKGYGMAFCCM